MNEGVFISGNQLRRKTGGECGDDKAILPFFGNQGSSLHLLLSIPSVVFDSRF